jgi:hypothetical protein
MKHEMFALIFKAIVLFLSSAFFGFLVVRGLKSGTLHGKYGISIRRDEGPLFFNCALICYTGLSLFSLYGCIKSLLLMFSN